MELQTKRRPLRPVLLAASILAACGGGGGSKGAPAPESLLFFSSASDGLLTAIDPHALTTQIPVEAGPAALKDVTLVRTGAYDAASGRLSGISSSAVAYFKDDGSGAFQLFRVSAARGATPAPVRVSNLSLPEASICQFSVEPDYHAPADSVAVIETATDCSAARTLVVTKLSAAATTAPVTYPVDGVEAVLALRDATGAIAGWLVQRGGEVWAEDAAFSDAGRKDLYAGYLEQVLSSGGGHVLVDLGGALKAYALGAATLADPGGVPTTMPASYAYNYVTDEGFLYVADQADAGTIFRVKRDGSSGPATVTTLPTGRNVGGLVVLASRVAYRDQATGAWFSVPKAGGDEVAMYSPANTSAGELPYAAGGAAFFNYEDGTAAFVKEDGTGLVTYGDGTTTNAFLGYVLGATSPIGAPDAGDVRSLVLVESPTAGGDAVLTAVDPATGAKGAVLGAIPAGYSNVTPLADASGTATLFSASDSGNGGNGDIFSVDVAKASSLAHVTSTASVDEAFVGTAGCSTGTGLAAPALLGALALLRLRRRRA